MCHVSNPHGGGFWSFRPSLEPADTIFDAICLGSDISKRNARSRWRANQLDPDSIFSDCHLQALGL